jgi:hypothetical protein
MTRECSRQSGQMSRVSVLVQCPAQARRQVTTQDQSISQGAVKASFLQFLTSALTIKVSFLAFALGFEVLGGSTMVLPSLSEVIHFAPSPL